MVRYVHIPENKAYYKAQEDCCFETVYYDDGHLGITSKNDQEGDALNSWDLLCRCYPDVKMLPISEEEYYKVRKEVCDKLSCNNQF